MDSRGAYQLTRLDEEEAQEELESGTQHLHPPSTDLLTSVGLYRSSAARLIRRSRLLGLVSPIFNGPSLRCRLLIIVVVLLLSGAYYVTTPQSVSKADASVQKPSPAAESAISSSKMAPTPLKEYLIKAKADALAHLAGKGHVDGHLLLIMGNSAGGESTEK